MSTPNAYVATSRPRITLYEFEGSKNINHNGSSCKVIIRKDLISIGCSDITPEAAKYIWETWQKEFKDPNREIVL